MDITVFSKLSVSETEQAISDVVAAVKKEFGPRFWISKVHEESDLYKNIRREDFGFESESYFIVQDNTKAFDDFDRVARMFRSAIGKDNALVIYSYSEKPFPKEDYV